MRHVFKVLCLDTVAAGLLGTRGSTKDEIQNETGTRLVFSNRGDYFPGTHYRVLGIYAHEVQPIVQALHWVMHKVAEVGEEELKNPSEIAPELLGKEPGEYIFRFCVTKRMSYQIIGSGGKAITKIRAESGAKVFIENDTQMGHRTARIIGLPQQIVAGLEMINEFVQRECDAEDFSTCFAGIINFGDAAASGWVPPPEPPQPPGRGGGGGGGSGKDSAEWRGASVKDGAEWRGAGNKDSTEWRGAGGWDGADWRGTGNSSRGGGAEKGGHIRAGSSGAGAAALPAAAGLGREETTIQAEVDTLQEILAGFAPGTAGLQYCISSNCDSRQASVIIGKAGEHIKYVEETTRVNIDVDNGPHDDSSRVVNVVGPLLNIYTAHAMMMLKLRQTEAAREAEQQGGVEEVEDPAALKAKIAEMQQQLAMLQSMVA